MGGVFRHGAKLKPDLILLELNLAGVKDGVTEARFMVHFFQLPIVLYYYSLR